MKNVFLVGVAAALLSATSVSAAQTAIVCEIKGAKNGQWISPEYRFEWEKGSTKAEILDGVAYHYNKGPATGKVIRETEKKVAIDWVLKSAKDSDGNSVQFNYAMSYNKTNNRLRVVARPIGYANEFGRNGKCKLVE
ncbi:MAG: hypothetical protein JXR13_06995 [Thalassovita sp.]